MTRSNPLDVVVGCVMDDWRGSPRALIHHQRQWHGRPAFAECSVTALQARIDQITEEIHYAEDWADLTLEREMLLREIQRRDLLDLESRVQTQSAIIDPPPVSGRKQPSTEAPHE